MQLWLSRHSRYYHNLFQVSYTINTVPSLDKKQHLEHFNEINTAGLTLDVCRALAVKSEREANFASTINGFSVGLSTGTSGNQGIFVASEQERAEWVGAVLAKVLKPKLFKKQRIAFILRADNKLYQSVQSNIFEFDYYDIKIPIEEIVRRLNNYQPHVLMAQPSILVQLVHQKKIGLLNIAPTQMVSYAEVLDEEDRADIELSFKIRLDEVYQCTEGFLGTTCNHGTMHLNEDIIKVEKIRVDDKRFKPIITDFRRKTQPIIRYELNDILIEKKDPCPCGSVFTAIEKIEGRADDVFVLNGKEVYPDNLRRAIVLSDLRIVEYRIIQLAENEVSVYLTCEPDSFFECASNVEKSINKLLGDLEIDQIQIGFHQNIPHLSDLKKRRVIRLFKPNQS